MFLLFQSVSLSFDSSLSILNIKTRNLLYIDPLRNHACIPSAVQAASQVGACDMRVINSDQYDCISQQLFCLLCRGLCLYISLSLLYMSFSYDAYGKFYKFKFSIDIVVIVIYLLVESFTYFIRYVTVNSCYHSSQVF